MFIAMRWRNRAEGDGVRLGSHTQRNAKVQECVLKRDATLLIMEQIINESKLIRKIRREALKLQALCEKLRHSLRYRFSLDVCIYNLITNVNTNYADAKTTRAGRRREIEFEVMMHKLIIQGELEAELLKSMTLSTWSRSSHP